MKCLAIRCVPSKIQQDARPSFAARGRNPAAGLRNRTTDNVHLNVCEHSRRSRRAIGNFCVCSDASMLFVKPNAKVEGPRCEALWSYSNLRLGWRLMFGCSIWSHCVTHPPRLFVTHPPTAQRKGAMLKQKICIMLSLTGFVGEVQQRTLGGQPRQVRRLVAQELLKGSS